MLSRLAACCLVALALAPFTAPFRTCDLAVLFGDAPAQHMPVSDSHSTVAGDVNVANFPSILRMGRVRLVPLTGSSVVPAHNCAAATTVARGSVGSCLIRDGARQTANLRV